MKNEKRTAQIPLSVRRANAIEEAVSAINKISARNALPYHVLEDILYRLYIEARDGSEREASTEKMKYDKAMEIDDDFSRSSHEKEIENERDNKKDI